MSDRSRAPLTRRRLAATLVALAAVLALCLAAGLLFGAGRVELADVLGGAAADGSPGRAILLDVRLPRVLLAAVLGGALTVAGVVFQALLRNPLADPYVLGVSGGASIGGVLALMAGLGAGAIGVPVAAFAGALATLALLSRLSTVGGRLTVYTVLLTGAIFNAFSAALIYFLQSIASLEQLHSIVFYLMGRVPSLAAGTLALLGAAVLGTVGALWAMTRDYNALALGEEGARYLGVDVERVRRRSLVLGSLLTALAVSAAGMIGFVGLIVPHLLRLALGPDNRLLVPAGFLGGAAFLVLSDLIARVALAPNELPVGVVTALVGGPYFLYLLRARSRVHGPD